MAFYIKSFTRITSRLSNEITIRKYARWNSRMPRRVILPHKYKELENVKNVDKNEHDGNKVVMKDFNSLEYDVEKRKELDYSIKREQEAKIKLIKSQKKVSPVKKITTDMLETVIDTNGNLCYTKLRDNDHKIGTILINIKTKQFKNKSDLILLEGKRIINEALMKGCQLKYLVFSRQEEINYLVPNLPKYGAKIYKMPYKEMQMWSDLTTCPGIMGFFKTPDTETTEPPENHLPLSIICDNIREPGNLGAIIRCASALPCEKLILTNGCVNLWDPKVTRTACGSQFSIPIMKKVDWKRIHELIPSDSNVYIADNKIVSSQYSKQDATMNSELFQLVKSIPLIPYYSVNFNKKLHNVIIIGGETEGISYDSYKFGQYFSGTRVNIPLCANVESLNTGTALGIIMFEFKRQMLSKSANRLVETQCN